MNRLELLSRTLRGWFVRGLCVAILGGCQEGDDSARDSGSDRAIRVASLSPGVTATIIALGAQDRLVGRTPWCLEVPGVPVVGTLLDLDAEALVNAEPTVILVQPPAQGESPALESLAAVQRWGIVRFRLDSLEDVRALIAALPAVLARESDSVERARLVERAERLNRALDAELAPLAHAASRGRILLLLAAGEGADAIAFGSGTYLGEFLSRIGARNAIERAGYPALSAEDIVRIAPDTIVLLGSRPARMTAQISASAPTAALFTLDFPEILQPGGGMIAGLKSLRGLIAGENHP